MQNLSALVSEVIGKDPYPVDVLEVTAVLESLGISDTLAAEKYRAASTFELAHAVYAELIATQKLTPHKLSAAPITAREPFSLKDARHGLFILVPGLILIAMLRYFASGAYDSNHVMALSWGVTSGMLAASGFTNGMIRRTSYLLGSGQIQAASQYLTRGLLTSIVTIGVFSATLSLLLAAFEWVSTSVLFLFNLCFVAMAIIWIIAGILSLVKGTVWIGVSLFAATAIGIGADQVLSRFLPQHLAVSAVVTFTVAVLGLLFGLRRSFASMASKQPKPFSLPPTPFLVFEALPYFGYGLLYALFILVPHILIWLGALPPDKDRLYVVYSLEAGLMLALPPLIMAAGFMEFVLRQFWREAVSAQATTSGATPGQFSKRILHLYRQRRAQHAILIIGLSLAMAVLFEVARYFQVLELWVNLSDLNAVATTFYAGLIAYGLMSWSAYNGMFCLTLDQPNVIARAIFWGLAAMLGIGVLLGAGVHYSFISFALIFGSLIIALVSTKSTTNVLRSADYYFYVATT